MSGAVATIGSGFFGANDIVARPYVDALMSAYERATVEADQLTVEVNTSATHEAAYVITAIHAVDQRDRGERLVVAGEVRDEAGVHHHFILHCYSGDDIPEREQPMRGCFNVM